MKMLARIVVGMVSTLGIYCGALWLWFLGQYLAVFDASGHGWRATLVPPLLFTLVYLAWFIAWRGQPRVPIISRRSLIHLAVAGAAATVLACVQALFGFGSNLTPALTAGVLMMSVSAISLAVERSVRRALLIAMLAMAAILPIVVAGRMIAFFIPPC